MSSQGAEKAGRPAALAFILVTVVLDNMALGITAPVLPRLIEGFAGGPEAGGFLNGVFVAVWALMQFVCSPIQGSLSDRFGRRAIVLLAVTGLSLDYVLMALAPDLWWLLVGRILSGACSANASAAFAYLADVTPPDKRAARYGMVGACFGLGYILGPALGGVIGEIHPRAPFWAAAALCGLNALWGLFVLPESLPWSQRTPFSWRRASPMGAMRLLAGSRAMLDLAVVHVLNCAASGALAAVFVLYAANRYGWSVGMTGVSLAVAGLCGALVQAGLTGWVVRRLGERPTLVLGLVLGAVSLGVYGLAPDGVVFLCGIPLMALWGMAGPATQALMSRQVAASEQGQLQGASMSLQGLAAIGAPLAFGAVYSLSVASGGGAGPLSGLTFGLGALVLVGAAILAARGRA